MDRKEAILRIKDHMEHHKVGEYPHLKLKEALDMAIAALDTPNVEKPPCYLPEKDNPYPLCKGRGMNACAHCCLWGDYDPEEDEGRVNQPLTIRQLREMDGEPVWIVDIGGRNWYGPGWAIVDRENNLVRTVKNWNPVFFEKYGERWLAYRRPPEGEA